MFKHANLGSNEFVHCPWRHIIGIFWRQRSYHVKRIERIVQYRGLCLSFLSLISMIFEPPANNEQETVIETFSYQTFNDCKHRIIFRVKRHTIQFNTLKIEKQMDCGKEELGGTRQWSSLQPWYLFYNFFLLLRSEFVNSWKYFFAKKSSLFESNWMEIQWTDYEQEWNAKTEYPGHGHLII